MCIRDSDESENIRAMLQRDSGIQAIIARQITQETGATMDTWKRKTGIFASHLTIEQNDYSDRDFQYAFGAIDRLDFEVDFDAGTIHVWFQDRYEWHPVYPNLYTKFPDDIPRFNNCVHAALVELKRSGAADFWIKGEATLPLESVMP